MSSHIKDKIRAYFGIKQKKVHRNLTRQNTAEGKGGVTEDQHENKHKFTNSQTPSSSSSCCGQEPPMQKQKQKQQPLKGHQHHNQYQQLQEQERKGKEDLDLEEKPLKHHQRYQQQTGNKVCDNPSTSHVCSVTIEEENSASGTPRLETEVISTNEALGTSFSSFSTKSSSSSFSPIDLTTTPSTLYDTRRNPYSDRFPPPVSSTEVGGGSQLGEGTVNFLDPSKKIDHVATQEKDGQEIVEHFSPTTKGHDKSTERNVEYHRSDVIDGENNENPSERLVVSQADDNSENDQDVIYMLFSDDEDDEYNEKGDGDDDHNDVDDGHNDANNGGEPARMDNDVVQAVPRTFGENDIRSNGELRSDSRITIKQTGPPLIVETVASDEPASSMKLEPLGINSTTIQEPIESKSCLASCDPNKKNNNVPKPDRTQNPHKLMTLSYSSTSSLIQSLSREGSDTSTSTAYDVSQDKSSEITSSTDQGWSRQKQLAFVPSTPWDNVKENNSTTVKTSKNQDPTEESSLTVTSSTSHRSTDNSSLSVALIPIQVPLEEKSSIVPKPSVVTGTDSPVYTWGTTNDQQKAKSSVVKISVIQIPREVDSSVCMTGPIRDPDSCSLQTSSSQYPNESNSSPSTTSTIKDLNETYPCAITASIIQDPDELKSGGLDTLGITHHECSSVKFLPIIPSPIKGSSKAESFSVTPSTIQDTKEVPSSSVFLPGKTPDSHGENLGVFLTETAQCASKENSSGVTQGKIQDGSQSHCSFSALNMIHDTIRAIPCGLESGLIQEPVQEQPLEEKCKDVDDTEPQIIITSQHNSEESLQSSQLTEDKDGVTPSNVDQESPELETDVSDDVSGPYDDVVVGPESLLDAFRLQSVVGPDGLLDAFRLQSVVDSSRQRLNIELDRFRKSEESIKRQAKYIDQLGKEIALVKQMTQKSHDVTKALRQEANDQKSILAAACDLKGGALKESQLQRLENRCYKKYLAIRDEKEASRLLDLIGQKQATLSRLEALVHRKRLVFKHSLPVTVKEKPSTKLPVPKKLKGSTGREGKASSRSDHAPPNVVVEIVPTPGQPPSDLTSWARIASYQPPGSTFQATPTVLQATPSISIVPNISLARSFLPSTDLDEVTMATRRI